jgi:hypothetical protein
VAPTTFGVVEAFPDARRRRVGTVRVATQARSFTPKANPRTSRSVTTDRGGPPPRVGKSVTRRAGSSALLSARSVSGAPAFLSPLGGSRFPVAATSERRPDTQITPPIRLRTDQAVAKCLSLLARLELGDDLPCPTVDDNECLQGTEFSRRTHQTPGPSMLTKRSRPTWDRCNDEASRGSARKRRRILSASQCRPRCGFTDAQPNVLWYSRASTN